MSSRLPDPIFSLGPTGREDAYQQRIEQARNLACWYEALIAWQTPMWRRDPEDTAAAIETRGYAVYDGPSAQPATGSPGNQGEERASDDT